MTNEKKNKTPYFIMPVDLFERGLSPYELAVYAYLCRCADKEGLSFPSVHTVANACCVGISTARRALHSLEQKGLIAATAHYIQTATGQPRRSSNHYLIGEDANARKQEEGTVRETGDPCQRDRGVLSEGQGGTVRDDRAITNSNITNTNITNLTLTNSTLTSDCVGESEGENKEKSFETFEKKSLPPFFEEQLSGDAFYSVCDGSREIASLCRLAMERLWNLPSITAAGKVYDNAGIRAAFDPPPAVGYLATAIGRYQAAHGVKDPAAYLAACYFRAVVCGENKWTERDEDAAAFFGAAMRRQYGDLFASET